MKSVKEINERIRRGEAVVLTAKELCDMVRSCLLYTSDAADE